VGVAELIVAVRVGLEQAAADACPAADGDRSERVTIAELIAAVGAALEGCPPVLDAAHTRQLGGEIVDRSVDPMLAHDARRAEDGDAELVAPRPPQAGQIVDDLPEAEHRALDDLRRVLLVGQADQIVASHRPIDWVHRPLPSVGDT
jgi:hypothetical protein